MANMIQGAKDRISEILTAAYNKAVEKGELPAGAALSGSVEIPKDTANGDYAANHAMTGAKALHMAPRKIAEALVANMELEGSWFSSVEVAGPGFINFRLAESWYSDVLRNIAAEGANYGRVDVGHGQRLMVEFVSANPTGPMHMGNARGGVLGDALASVLDRAGYQVWREFYVNDAGNQIEKFATSIDARYQQLILGEDQVEFPEDGYHGDDIKDLAKAFYDAYGEKYLQEDVKTRHEAMARFGLDRNIPKMQSDLRRYGIEYDQWFFESELHESGYVAESVQLLTDRGYTYEKDGALWLKTSQIITEHMLKNGKKQADIDKLELKDDVLRRANGFYTYFAADIAYHRNKFEKRGFDRVINVWGADHHGHVARLQGAMDAVGLDGDKLDVVLMQLVELMRNGKPERMSKRTGKAITLTDLLEEVPIDAARFLFNMREPNTHLIFDLDLAVEQSNQNPVYYVQYAHARICSILRALAEEGVTPKEDISLYNYTEPEELALVSEIAKFPVEIAESVKSYNPARITKYAVDLATMFHQFYNACRCRGVEEDVMYARIALCLAAKTTIKNVLTMLKVTVPESM